MDMNDYLNSKQNLTYYFYNYINAHSFHALYTHNTKEDKKVVIFSSTLFEIADVMKVLEWV